MFDGLAPVFTVIAIFSVVLIVCGLPPKERGSGSSNGSSNE